MTTGDHGGPASDDAPRETQGHPGLRWGGDGSLSEIDRRQDPRPGAAWGAPESSTPPEAGRAAGILSNPAGEYATFIRRTAAWLLDLFIKLLLVDIVFLAAGVGPVLDPFDPVTLLSVQALNRGYDWIFWAQGWTPGARLLRMRIVTEEGLPPGWGPAFRRVMGSILSELALMVGYLWVLWDGRKQTWHDKIAGTYVVRTRQ